MYAHEYIHYDELCIPDHELPMTRAETAVWLVYCIAGSSLVYWIDATPADGFVHYAKGVGLGIVLALWVSMIKPPLRWWIAAVFSADIMWLKADLLAAKLGYTMKRLPDLTEIDWAVWCWCGGGFLAGWLYVVVRGWSFSLDGDDFPAATHCLFWGAFVGPVLLAGVLVAWWRARKAWASLSPETELDTDKKLEAEIIWLLTRR